MMYLLLSVAGHLTIFQTRTRGPWWSIRPAGILLLAVVGTQAVATLICVFGFLVAPLWWGWAAMVWVYALAWFLVTDPVKLLAYHVLDATKPVAALQSKVQPQSDAEPRLLPQAESKPGGEAVPQPNPVSKLPVPVEPRSAVKAEAPSDTRPGFAAKIEATPDHEINTEGRRLMNTKLGDFVAAGILTNPEDAGRIIADGIVSDQGAARCREILIRQNLTVSKRPTGTDS